MINENLPFGDSHIPKPHSFVNSHNDSLLLTGISNIVSGIVCVCSIGVSYLIYNIIS